MKVSSHFSSIKEFEPNILVCNISNKIHLITVYQISPDLVWNEIGRYYSIINFQEKMGSLEEWTHIKLTFAQHLQMYDDGSNYTTKSILLIVEPTQAYYDCHLPKANVLSTYFMKDPYQPLRDKLPELIGIF